MHTTFDRGTPLRITLRSGGLVFGKFVSRHNTFIRVREHDGSSRDVDMRDMRAISVTKGRQLVHVQEAK